MTAVVRTGLGGIHALLSRPGQLRLSLALVGQRLNQAGKIKTLDLKSALSETLKMSNQDLKRRIVNGTN